jgi:hypothetical protein
MAFGAGGSTRSAGPVEVGILAGWPDVRGRPGSLSIPGGFSLLAGNTFGRVIAIIGGSLGAIGALLSIGGNYPWWSLAIFALCVYIVHGILVYGEDARAART